jgi:hypothetical protein
MVGGMQHVCRCVLVCGTSVVRVWDGCGVLIDQLTTANCVVASHLLTQHVRLEMNPTPRCALVSPQGLEP